MAVETLELVDMHSSGKDDTLEVEGDKKRSVYLNITNAGHQQYGSLNITRDDAIRLRDWLNQWLEETK